MSTADGQWVSTEQYRGIQTGIRVLDAWIRAGHEPEDALQRALQREPDAGDVVVGLATVSRLLAIELATATGDTEATVLARLATTVARMQHCAPASRNERPDHHRLSRWR